MNVHLNGQFASSPGVHCNGQIFFSMKLLFNLYNVPAVCLFYCMTSEYIKNSKKNSDTVCLSLSSAATIVAS